MAIKTVHVKAHTRKLHLYTKTFTEGSLKGLTINQQSTVKPRYGEVVGGGFSGGKALIGKRKKKK